MVKRKSKVVGKNKKEVMSFRNKVLVVLLMLFFILLLFFGLLFIRNVLPRQVDDVSPLISCDKSILDKSRVLMVIPIFENKSIALNKTWCEEILALNKTLGMHGVYHTYNEFSYLRNESYIKKGVEEFKKCFGYYPEIFEAPQLALNSQNMLPIMSLNMSIYGNLYQLTHKIYHCEDTGKFSNRFVDLF